MGTNYYVKSKTCECCGHKPEPLHIGKSSHGWTFIFRSHENLKSCKEWYRFLIDEHIEDEYGRAVSLTDFFNKVYSKQSEPYNHAIEYPEGCYIDDDGFTFKEGEFS